jgi:hypothetical protein
VTGQISRREGWRAEAFGYVCIGKEYSPGHSNAAAQEESHGQVVHPPNFQELQEQIKEALAAYKQRQAAIASIRESLSKARKQEADAPSDSLTDTSPKLIDKIAKSRVSRQLTVAEESLAGGLEFVAQPMRQLQARLIRELANLKAKRTKAHYEILTRGLDADAVTRFCVSLGLGRGDLLFSARSLRPRCARALRAFIRI